MKYRSRFLWLATVFSYFSLLQPLAALAYPGSLDTTFGNNGVSTHYVGKKTVVHKVLVQPDGKIVVVATVKVVFYNLITQDRVYVARFTSTGALDLVFPSSPLGIGFDAALQPDGRLVVLGRAPNTLSTLGGTINTNSPAVWRFTTGGTLDSTFGDNGRQFISQIDAPAIRANYNVAVSSGKIFIGYASKSPLLTYNTSFRYRISRLSGSGAIDFTIAPPFNYIDGEAAFRMKVDGDIYAVGPKATTLDAVLRRYTQNGDPELGFGTNGEATVPDCVPNELLPKDLVIQPDGNILVHRFNGDSGYVSVSRQLSSGGDDPAFACVSGGLPPATGQTLYLQPDGKFFYYVGLVGGAFRYYPDGNFDLHIVGFTYHPSVVQPDQKVVSAFALYPDYTTIRLERKLFD